MRKLVLIVFVGLLAFAGFTRWQSISEEPLIMTDGQGYYAYLPAIFLYQDLQFSFVDSLNQTYYKEDKRAKFIVPSDEGNVNKYFAGTAVLEAPFFLGGCALAAITGTPVDGYSWPFQLMIGLAAIVYLALGLYLLGSLLIGFGIKENAVLVTLLLIAFGTNLFYYTVYEPSMSHVFSFCTISAFLFFTWKTSRRMSVSSVALAAVALGLTVLIRPTNVIVVLGIPVITAGLSGTYALIKRLLENKRALVAAIVAFVVFVSVQPIIYVLQTGSIMVWSYEGEGFNFLAPEFYNVLLSYRKGLLVYAPVLALAFLGTTVGFTKNLGRYMWLAVFLFVATWVIASWWMWYYGGCFGHRAFIDHYPFFAIGIATVLHYGIGFIRPWVFSLLAMVFIPIQLIQTYQYNKHIITFDSMTKTKYWNLFLRTGDDLAWYYSGYEGQDSYKGLDSLVVKHDFETELGWGNEQQVVDDPIREGRIAKMTSEDGYGPTFRKEVAEIGVPLNNVRISAYVNSNSRSSNIAFVCSLEDSTGAGYYWQKYPLRPQFDGTGNWSWTTALFRCGTPQQVTDKFVIYPMKSDGSTILIDDLEISFIQAE